MVCIRYRKNVKKALVKRQGRVGVVTGKVVKKDFYNPKHIADPGFKAVFDTRKSWKRNGDAVDLKALYGDVLPDCIPDRSIRNAPKLSELEVSCLQRLQNKHGDSTSSMARDRKLNEYQWTSEQCERKLVLLAESRVHVCSDKCLCGTHPNSSNVKSRPRI